MIPQLAKRVRTFVVCYPGSTVLLGIGFALALFAFGIVLGASRSVKTMVFSKLRANPHVTYEFISPLLQCESSWSDQDQIISLLRRRLSALHKKLESSAEIDSLSVRYVNLHTGAWFEIDGEVNYAPASLIKIPVLMAYLKKAETDSSLLDERILVPDQVDGVYEQNIAPDAVIQPGKEYTVRELLQYMIAYSDNTADTVLRQRLTDRELFAVLELVGIDSYDVRPLFSVENFMSVSEVTALMRILYNATYLSEEYSEYALSLLSESTFDEGLRSDIPKTIPIAHKFAERRYLDTGEVQLHDCGIIYVPEMPYTLCVMTKGSDMDVLAEAIQSISSTAYQLQSAASQ